MIGRMPDPNELMLPKGVPEPVRESLRDRILAVLQRGPATTIEIANAAGSRHPSIHTRLLAMAESDTVHRRRVPGIAADVWVLGPAPEEEDAPRSPSGNRLPSWRQELLANAAAEEAGPGRLLACIERHPGSTERELAGWLNATANVVHRWAGQLGAKVHRTGRGLDTRWHLGPAPADITPDIPTDTNPRSTAPEAPKVPDIDEDTDMDTDALRTNAIEYIRAHPGLAGADVGRALGLRKPHQINTLGGELRKAEALKQLRREGKGPGTRWFVVEASKSGGADAPVTPTPSPEVVEAAAGEGQGTAATPEVQTVRVADYVEEVSRSEAAASVALDTDGPVRTVSGDEAVRARDNPGRWGSVFLAALSAALGANDLTDDEILVEIGVLKATRDAFREERDQLQDQLAKRTAEHAVVHEMNDRLQAENTALQGNLATYAQEQVRMSDELTGLRETIATLTAEIDGAWKALGIDDAPASHTIAAELESMWWALGYHSTAHSSRTLAEEVRRSKEPSAVFETNADLGLELDAIEHDVDLYLRGANLKAPADVSVRDRLNCVIGFHRQEALVQKTRAEVGEEMVRSLLDRVVGPRQVAS